MILILGGNGFVGRHVARRLLSLGHRVAVSVHRRPLASEAEAVALDITDSFAVVEVMMRLKPRIVIDLSGHPPKALSPGRDVAFRTGALINLLEAARIAEVGRVVLMSSMDVYWGLDTAAGPFTEDDPVPLIEQDDHFIVQSWVKKSLEVIGNLYRRQHRMDIVFVRASGVYGPGYSTYLNMPSRLVRAAITGQPALSAALGPEYAQSGYDQLYVDDMARAIGLVALTTTLAHPVYNIGSGRAAPYAEFAAAVGAALPNRPSNEAPGPMDGRYMAIERARDDLGFTPEFDPAAGMADYLAWVKQHGL
jgi:nucleoside-diphosphate-sugar epimerase